MQDYSIILAVLPVPVLALASWTCKLGKCGVRVQAGVDGSESCKPIQAY